MIWKIHPIYQKYEISDDGQARHIEKGKLRRLRIDLYGYYRINLRHNKKTITTPMSHLVVETFIGQRNGLTINHKNGIKTDNSVDNLELIKSGENTTHAFRNGLVGICHPCEINGTNFYSKREAERITGIPRRIIA